jgi:hypothetical protein
MADIVAARAACSNAIVIKVNGSALRHRADDDIRHDVGGRGGMRVGPRRANSSAVWTPAGLPSITDALKPQRDWPSTLRTTSIRKPNRAPPDLAAVTSAPSAQAGTSNAELISMIVDEITGTNIALNVHHEHEHFDKVLRDIERASRRGGHVFELDRGMRGTNLG